MMEKIKNTYSAHPIVWTLLLLVILIGLSMLLWYMPAFSMQAAELPAPESVPVAKGEKIPLDIVVSSNNKATRKGESVVVAEKAGRTLIYDPVAMAFTLKDENGTTWCTSMPGAETGPDKSLLLLEFVGKNNVFATFNSYDNGAALYSSVAPIDPETGLETGPAVNSFYDNSYLIEDGVRIEMHVLENKKKLMAYMPRTMSKESYDFFMRRIEELEAEGVEIPASYVNAFTTYWKVHPVDTSKYPFQVSGDSATPSADRQIIALAELVGYTREMLLADCAAYGHTAESPQLADFSVVLEVTLNDEGELIARVPTSEIVNHNDYFKLQRIHVLPNLCAEAASKDGKGYYLVPDGAGALMEFNSSDATVGDVLRPFMNNDLHQDYFWQSEFSEELMMPVYGVMYGGAQSTHGMLAIIEEGAETANLHVSIATPTTGKNKIYASIDTIEHSWVRIYGAYADNTASYLADSGHIETDFTVRFIPYDGPVTYYDMAMDYRDYLAETAGMTPETPEGPGLYLEMMGAVTLTERFVGVPYDSIHSMTTFAEAKEIVEALKDYDVTYQYDGALNGGMLNALNKGAALVGENGSADELSQLRAAAEAAGSDLFLQVNLSRVYDNGRNYIPYLHASRDFSNSAMTLYLYRADTAQMNGRWDPIREYTTVSPRYFSHLATSFKQAQSHSDALRGADLAIGDLAHDVFADYRYRDIINPVQSRAFVRESLNTLAQDDSTLSLNDPFADVAAMGDYAVGVSRLSSDYASYYATVPFRQLALSGLTTVVGTDVNLSSRDLDFFLLQAAELGTSVKYTICAQNPDILKNSHFEGMYAVHWDAWQPEILEAAQACAQLREDIGGRAITGHAMLKPQVFETTYEGGVKVITNYSALPYESTNGTVGSGSYLLIPAAQEGGAL